MKKTILSLSILSLSYNVPAQADGFFDNFNLFNDTSQPSESDPFPGKTDSFADFDAEMNEYEKPDTDKIVQEYVSFVTDCLTEYDAWRKEYLNGFDKEQEKIIDRWGETTKQEITNVSYSEDLNSRELVDYEKNEVVIEILVPVATTEAQSKKILAEHLSDNGNKASLLTEQDKKVINSSNIETYPIAYDAAQEEVAKEVIKQQTIAYQQEVEMTADKLQEEQADIPQAVIDLSINKQKEQLQQEEAARLAKVAVQYEVLRAEQVQEPTYKVLKYTVKLPSNSLAIRAGKYSGFAESESERFDIPVALIMAIMHSESSFDPQAKSGVPAYGLMQIVPRTAGHDVNKLVRKIDEPMKAADLYVPNINVETGSAYLDILNTRYLKAITDSESRLYCTIAAYNTGAGNVARVFNVAGEGNVRNINRAALKINQLTSQEVYDTLMADLPYDEAKHYLEKVSQRIPLYEATAKI